MNVYKKNMGSYNWLKEEIYAKERESLLFVMRWEEGSGRVYIGITVLLCKEYIRLSKLPQIVLVFFVGKKDGKKRMMQDCWYLNE